MKALFVITLLALTTSYASAVSPVNKSTFGGLAIKGYDPVGYFTERKAVKGSQEFETEHAGAKWRFVSQENLKLFTADPEAYAPQFGDYCAWAVSQGYTANIDPEAWKIVDGKLYLNYNKPVQEKWEKDAENLIKKANQNWPELLKE